MRFRTCLLFVCLAAGCGAADGQPVEPTPPAVATAAQPTSIPSPAATTLAGSPAAESAGAGAAALIDALSTDIVRDHEIEVLGPAKGTWLVRAESHEALSDALSRVPRPAERVRIDVDPLRI